MVSTQQLEQHIGNQKVSCAVKNKDQYGRNVAVCSAGGEDLNRWMVQNGLAVAYREFSSDYVRVRASNVHHVRMILPRNMNK